MISHLSLKKIKSLSASVSLQADQSGFEFLIIEHKKLNAAFTLHGGQLIHFQKTGQPALIWLSKTAIFDNTKAIRGGVPICWPWFGGANPELGENLPSHGFARTSKWSLGNIEESEQGIELELTLQSNDQTLAFWPYPFELTLKATLNDELKLELIINNTGSTAFTYQGALHTYLNISAPESIDVSGLSTQFANSLKNGKIETSQLPLKIDQAIDAIYKKSDTNVKLNDAQLARTITISNTGNDSEVLWTPWIEGAKAFADMPDDGYKTMLCIESAVTEKSGKQLQAAQQTTISTLIK